MALKKGVAIGPLSIMSFVSSNYFMSSIMRFV